MFHTIPPTPVTVRRAHPSDAFELARLAALDSGPVPQPPALVAEAGGRILAALPLRGGLPVADPFAPTAELVELLHLRARQLESGSRNVHPLRRLLGPRPAAA